MYTVRQVTGITRLRITRPLHEHETKPLTRRRFRANQTPSTSHLLDPRSLFGTVKYRFTYELQTAARHSKIGTMRRITG